MPQSSFGACCNDLKDGMTSPPNSFFRVEKNGVLYLTVGYIATQGGPGWLEQAVIFCPFCGRKIQDKDEIARSSKEF